MVAGSSDSASLVSKNIRSSVTNAASLFLHSGLSGNQLSLLSDEYIDANGDGANDQDATATLQNIKRAIQHWQGYSPSNPSQAFIYLVGGGQNGRFQVGANEWLSGEQLYLWLRRSYPSFDRITLFLEFPDASTFGQQLYSYQSSQRANDSIRPILNVAMLDDANGNIWTTVDGFAASEILWSRLREGYNLTRSMDATSIFLGKDSGSLLPPLSSSSRYDEHIAWSSGIAVEFESRPTFQNGKVQIDYETSEIALEIEILGASDSYTVAAQLIDSSPQNEQSNHFYMPTNYTLDEVAYDNFPIDPLAKKFHTTLPSLAVEDPLDIIVFAWDENGTVASPVMLSLNPFQYYLPLIGN